MGEFFRGWRRKIGVMTLLTACVFAVGMVRSSLLRDRFEVQIGRTRYCLISVDGLCRFTRYVSDDPPPLVFWNVRSAHSGGPTDVVDSAPIRWDWHFYWYEIEFGQGDFRNGAVPITVFAAPFWIVIPLTLLSAYLLLSKPRPTQRAASPVTTSN